MSQARLVPHEPLETSTGRSLPACSTERSINKFSAENAQSAERFSQPQLRLCMDIDCDPALPFPWSTPWDCAPFRTGPLLILPAWGLRPQSQCVIPQSGNWQPSRALSATQGPRQLCQQLSCTQERAGCWVWMPAQWNQSGALWTFPPPTLLLAPVPLQTETFIHAYLENFGVQTAGART